MNKITRTRFAPSPTGFLHVGGVRTALFAWLIAKQNKGQFILRIEDTDKVREVAGSEQHIIDSLHFIGIDWDEGPDIGGNYGPYRQSDKLAIYKEWAQKLVDKGRAYPDPYTQVELDQFREKAKVEKRPFLFRDHRPKTFSKWDGNTTLRFKSDPKPYVWHDAVMGELSNGEEVIDDFIIMKNDGYPTYNFAHIIDDHLMKITHVIRSQEFISSTPKFLNLYEALEFERPVLATVPFVLGPDGKKKLSKRDGAKDILDYKKEGYTTEALLNFLVTLGWNDGTTQEIFSKKDLIEKFSIERVSRSGAKFDEQRLLWLNGHYIREMDIDSLFMKAQSYFPKEADSFDEKYKKNVLSIIQERLKFYSEIPSLTSFFFSEPVADLSLIQNNKQLSKVEFATLRSLLTTAINSFEGITFEMEKVSETLNNLLEKTNQKPAILFSLIRIVTTWAPSSPGLVESLTVLGKKTTLERMQNALNLLSN